MGRHRTRNRKVVGLIPIDWYIEDLEELFVSQMLTIDNVFSALLSVAWALWKWIVIRLWVCVVLCWECLCCPPFSLPDLRGLCVMCLKKKYKWRQKHIPMPQNLCEIKTRVPFLRTIANLIFISTWIRKFFFKSINLYDTKTIVSIYFNLWHKPTKFKTEIKIE